MHRCDKVMFTVLWIVAITQVYSAEQVLNNLNRTRRQDWIWGLADKSASKSQSNKPNQRQQTTESTITTTEFNPCLLPLPKMPDFNAPGRRISVTKCYEYIWNIKFREEKASNDIQCTLYKLKKAYGNETRFAIGGRKALPGEFPHMAAIGWKAAIGTWVFKCGSSLISNKFVLTAAHCTRATREDTSITDVWPKIVRIGDKNILDIYTRGLDPRDVNISRIIVHPQYKSPWKSFDIALMELKTVVKFDFNAQPACLWTNFDTSSLGRVATLTGWGVVKSGGRKTPPDLQVAVVDVIDSQQCDALLRPRCNKYWCGIQDHQICAGKLAGGVDACKGDSGGPLQIRIPTPPSSEGSIHYVIGVTSFGFGCARVNTPGVYTRVSSFIDWIEDIVWR